MNPRYYRLFTSIIETHRAFWLECPALAVGVSVLLGAFLFFEHSYSIAIIWLGYIFILFPLKGLVHLIILMVIALQAHLLYSNLPSAGSGQAIFSIHSVKLHSSPFQNGWLYQGTLHAFQNETNQWSLSIPCNISFMGNAKERPKANFDYILTGKLVKRSDFEFTFKVKSWEKIPGTWSLAEWRCQSKEKIREILNYFIKDTPTTAFLTALFTGDIDNRMLQFEFSRLGLQYLLVISGFHFAILAAFVSFILRQIFSSRICIWFLLAVFTIYFIFVGNSPPVERSYFAASIYLIGQLLHRRASGLNILGVCLLMEVILNPIIVRNIGFQLSFLSCFGIFLLHRPIQQKLNYFFPIRKFQETTQLSVLSQCIYVIVHFFSKAVCLTLAVNIALFPLLLFHFHRFPWLSLIYNLFAPGWTALSLFLFLLALTTYAFYPLFSLPIFKIVDIVSSNLLELISHPPAILDYGLSFCFPCWAIAPYIIIFLLVALYYRQR